MRRLLLHLIVFQSLLIVAYPLLAGELEDSIEGELNSAASGKKKDAKKDDKISEDEGLDEELDEGDAKESNSGSAASAEEEEDEILLDEGDPDGPDDATASSDTSDTPDKKAEADPDADADLDAKAETETETETDMADADAELLEEKPVVKAPEKKSKSEVEKTPEPAHDIYGETLGGFDDHVNMDFERRISHIFSQSRPMSAAQWDSMVGSRASGSYRVQRGDSLWAVSKTMFGDGSFWPKLWAENAAFGNPHQIEIGDSITFVAGNEESAPVVNVANTTIDIGLAQKGSKLKGPLADGESARPVYPDDPEARLSEEDVAAGTVLEDQPIVGGRPDIPPPLAQSKAPLKNLPNSFVQPVPPQVEKTFDGTGLDSGRRASFDTPATMFLTSYLAEENPASVGAITEIESSEKTAGYLDHVFVSGKRALQIGERLTVLMARGNISHVKTHTYGPVLEVGGVVQIRSVVNQEKQVYRAAVVRSIGTIEVGATLSEVAPPKATFSRSGPRADVQARIVGGEFDSQRKILGAGSVVYLDEGAKAGLSEGQVLAVRSTRDERRRDTQYPSFSQPVAVLKVAKVFSRVATAMIIIANGEIRPGDITGGPLPKIGMIFGKGGRVATNGKSVKPAAKNSPEVDDSAEFSDQELDQADEGAESSDEL